jgi:hypothetical protein
MVNKKFKEWACLITTVIPASWEAKLVIPYLKNKIIYTWSDSSDRAPA